MKIYSTPEFMVQYKKVKNLNFRHGECGSVEKIRLVSWPIRKNYQITRKVLKFLK